MKYKLPVAKRKLQTKLWEYVLRLFFFRWLWFFSSFPSHFKIRCIPPIEDQRYKIRYDENLCFAFNFTLKKCCYEENALLRKRVLTTDKSKVKILLRIHTNKYLLKNIKQVILKSKKWAKDLFLMCSQI